MARHSSRIRRRPQSRGRGRRRGNTAVNIGLVSASRKGYAFVDTPEGEYFIRRSCLNGAMNGDLVEVRRLEATRLGTARLGTTRSRRLEGGHEMMGSVYRVLQHAHSTLIGVVRMSDGLSVVIPDDEKISYDIFLDRSASLSAGAGVAKDALKDGDLVVVRITTYPSKWESAQGYVEEILGHESDQGIDMALIIRRHGLETEFSPAALSEAEALQEQWKVGEHTGGSGGFGGFGGFGDFGGFEGPDGLPDRLPRRDLRERFVFTIDPADARDYDDALSVDYVDGIVRLGVHIADVSACVAWDSALDINARRRATSVYLPDRVIPMLPPALSDDICSLRPNVDRLVFTVDLYVRKDGTVQRAEFYPSVIHSSARLSYDEAQQMLEAKGSSSIAADDADAVDAANVDAVADNNIDQSASLALKIKTLHSLAKTLERKRIKRGAIDFDGVEPKIVLDENGLTSHIELRRKTDATALVEEAMILANEAVADYLLSRGEPCVYRIHDEPLQSALDEILPTLQEFGYSEQHAPQTSFEIQNILAASKSKAEYDLISALLLRAMKRARYHTAFTTHFGLASQAYTHFTSPIRRYPDLLVHRLLKMRLLAEQMGLASTEKLLNVQSDPALTSASTLASTLTPASAPALTPAPALTSAFASMLSQLDWLCEHCSIQEREAEQATYEAVRLKTCEFFAGRIGIRCRGVISAVNSHGFCVREETTHAEGFVSRDSFDEDLTYEPASYRWIDYDAKTRYRLGQAVAVTLAGVDFARMELKFTL